jgi:catechol 2,3-dioxygenase-like lactoylglutathione lyase family enzyme
VTDQEDVMPDPTIRANKIANVVIPVADQDRAIEFYAKLGFTTRVDLPFGDKYRWVEVGLGDESTTIALAPPPDAAPVGNRETGITLQTDDIDAFHRQLKDAGVDVDGEVARMGGGVPPMFWFRDPEGNTLLVVQ